MTKHSPGIFTPLVFDAFLRIKMTGETVGEIQKRNQKTTNFQLTTTIQRLKYTEKVQNPDKWEPSHRYDYYLMLGIFQHG